MSRGVKRNRINPIRVLLLLSRITRFCAYDESIRSTVRIRQCAQAICRDAFIGKELGRVYEGSLRFFLHLPLFLATSLMKIWLDFDFFLSSSRSWLSCCFSKGSLQGFMGLFIFELRAFLWVFASKQLHKHAHPWKF